MKFTSRFPRFLPAGLVSLATTSLCLGQDPTTTPLPVPPITSPSTPVPPAVPSTTVPATATDLPVPTTTPAKKGKKSSKSDETTPKANDVPSYDRNLPKGYKVG